MISVDRDILLNLSPLRYASASLFTPTRISLVPLPRHSRTRLPKSALPVPEVVAAVTDPAAVKPQAIEHFFEGPGKKIPFQGLQPEGTYCRQRPMAPPPGIGTL